MNEVVPSPSLPLGQVTAKGPFGMDGVGLRGQDERTVSLPSILPPLVTLPSLSHLDRHLQRRRDSTPTPSAGSNSTSWLISRHR